MLKKINFVAVMAFILAIAGFHNAWAQPADGGNKTAMSLETDPSTFVFNGFAVHLRIRPANSRHLLVGAGAYALDFPDLMVGLNPKNKGKGWDVRITDAWSLFGEYYFDEAGRKWFAGLQAGIQNFRIRNEGLPGAESRYRNLILMPSVGYSWSPFRIPVYIKPWMGVGYTAKVSGNNRIEGAEYNVSPVVPFVTLHMGYVF